MSNLSKETIEKAPQGRHKENIKVVDEKNSQQDDWGTIMSNLSKETIQKPTQKKNEIGGNSENQKNILQIDEENDEMLALKIREMMRM